MKSNKSMDIPISFKEGTLKQIEGDQSEMAESISSDTLSMKSDRSMDIPLHFKGGVSLGPGDVSCDICSEVQAVKFCLTCSVSYCEPHIRQHYTIAALQRHTLVDVTGDLGLKLCQHVYSPLEVFCRTDQMLSCSRCAQTNHKGHDMISHEIKKAGKRPKSFDGDQHTTLTSDDGRYMWKHRINSPRTEPHITTTSSPSITLSDLKPATEYSVTVCTVLENGTHSQLVSTTFTTKHEFRIVLVGNTGAGKSASGNTILGRKVFPSKFSSVCLTKDCNKRKGKVGEQSVVVTDTPGLFDTTLSNEEGLRRIAPCISAPGPHVFLVVIKLGRFTEEEQRTVEMIQRFFGDEASKYTMVLFTHGESLDDDDVTIEDFLIENPDLESLLAKCKGGYHVFKNKDKNPSQVIELLEKIKKMVMMNRGRYYTNEMLQQAERKKSSCLVSLPCLFLSNTVQQANAPMRCFKRLREGSSKTRSVLCTMRVCNITICHCFDWLVDWLVELSVDTF